MPAPRTFRTLAALALSTIAAAVPCRAATWIVDPAGGGDATTIQGGVDLAGTGDVVLVKAGTYAEEVTISEAITLQSESGADATTIDAEFTQPACITSAGAVAGAVIDGFTLTRAGFSYGYCCSQYAVNVSGGFQFRECRVVGNFGQDGGAVFRTSGDVTVLDSDFEGNGCCGGTTDPGIGSAGFLVDSGSLLVQGCTFEGNSGTTNVLDLAGGAATFRGNVFRDNGQVLVYYRTLFQQLPGTQLVLEDNLFVDNQGQLLLDPFQTGSPVDVEIRGNTFARNAGLFVPDFVGEVPALAPGSIVRQNVFSGSQVGFALPPGSIGVTIACNDSWGNAVNWQGFTPVLGDGNFSEAPTYCDAANDVFTVASNSPLLPGNNACLELIGAFGQGCGPISIDAQSWGRVKAGYR